MTSNDDPYMMIFLKKCCYSWFKYMFVSKYYSMSISRSKFSFVGCLTTDPLLFVWDQYLITSDVPKFHDELIPAIAAAMIITLRDFLLKCKMVRYNHIQIFFVLFIQKYISSFIDIGNGSSFTTENKYYYYTAITIGDRSIFLA